MKITFLGTGTSQGVPVIGCTCEVCRSLDFRDKRLRTSVHLEVDNQSLLIDTGPDFRTQMLREGISKLNGVMYTHAHRDHTAGLDDIRAYNFLQKEKMELFGTPQVLDQLKSDFSYIFRESTYPGLPQLNLNTIGSAPFFIGKTRITPLPVLHLKLEVTGFRIGNFSYITDANYIPPETMKLLEGTSTLVLNALQQEPHVSHFNLNEALEIVKLINPDQTYLIHMSHKMGLHQEIQEQLPSGVYLSYDGLQLTL